MAVSSDSCVVDVQSLHTQIMDQLAVVLWNLDIWNPVCRQGALISASAGISVRNLRNFLALTSS